MEMLCKIKIGIFNEPPILYEAKKHYRIATIFIKMVFFLCFCNLPKIKRI